MLQTRKNDEEKGYFIGLREREFNFHANCFTSAQLIDKIVLVRRSVLFDA